MITRRGFLSAGAASIVAGSAASGEQAKARRKKMAIVTTEWRYRSHAWHMGERFLVGYLRHGKWHRPELEVVSAYVDQTPANDLSRKRAAEFGFKIYPDVASALRRGGDRLAV